MDHLATHYNALRTSCAILSQGKPPTKRCANHPATQCTTFPMVFAKQSSWNIPRKCRADHLATECKTFTMSCALQ